MRDARLIVCAVLSVVGHLAFAYGMTRLPRRVEPHARPATVAIRVVAPPPPEPPPEPPQPTPPPPRAVPHEPPRVRPTRAPAPPPPATPPPESPPPEPTPGTGASTTPVFGVTMESTSQAGSGPALPVGNSVRPSARREVGPVAAPALAPPVPAYEVTTMPLPQGRCAGRYTDEARAAAIEGTVVLDLVVGENGRVREVSVVSGLEYGLTAAAITAVKECRFSPGEKDGTPVPVRVRGFKIRFVLGE
jgi:TonB family protein